MYDCWNCAPDECTIVEHVIKTKDVCTERPWLREPAKINVLPLIYSHQCEWKLSLLPQQSLNNFSTSIIVWHKDSSWNNSLHKLLGVEVSTISQKMELGGNVIWRKLLPTLPLLINDFQRQLDFLSLFSPRLPHLLSSLPWNPRSLTEVETFIYVRCNINMLTLSGPTYLAISTPSLCVLGYTYHLLTSFNIHNTVTPTKILWTIFITK